MSVFRADLRAAKIEFLNAMGQRVDFHALGHTLATNLALAGTAPRVAMEVMRHSDMRLTSKNLYRCRVAAHYRCRNKSSVLQRVPGEGLTNRLTKIVPFRSCPVRPCQQKDQKSEGANF